MSGAGDRVILGRVSGVYGVRGWLRIYSFTDPRNNILSLSPWQLGPADDWRPATVKEGRIQGKGVVVHLAGVDDRDQARALIGLEIAIPRTQLPASRAGEYYWIDLEGLEVVNLRDVKLGRLAEMMATGANDVMRVEGSRERLIPFVMDEVVVSVDLQAGRLVVDWDEGF